MRSGRSLSSTKWKREFPRRVDGTSGEKPEVKEKKKKTRTYWCWQVEVDDEWMGNIPTRKFLNHLLPLVKEWGVPGEGRQFWTWGETRLTSAIRFLFNFFIFNELNANSVVFFHEESNCCNYRKLFWNRFRTNYVLVLGGWRCQSSFTFLERKQKNYLGMCSDG